MNQTTRLAPHHLEEEETEEKEETEETEETEEKEENNRINSQPNSYHSTTFIHLPLKPASPYLPAMMSASK